MVKYYLNHVIILLLEAILFLSEVITHFSDTGARPLIEMTKQILGLLTLDLYTSHEF